MPPCTIGSFSPFGFSRTKSAACAISSASHSSSSVASSRPNRRFEAIVPVNRNGRCGTSPIPFHSVSRSASRTSTPCTRTVPPVASNSRGIRLTSVVLPAPVDPMIATVSPGAARKLTPSMTGSSAPGYVNDTFSSSTEPGLGIVVTGCAGRFSELSTARTSPTRSADTAARGIMIVMNVAIITPPRI